MKKRSTSYDGRFRESNKINTIISDHVLRKPLKDFTIKINEKEIYNQLHCKRKAVPHSESLEARSIGDPVKKLATEMHKIAVAQLLGKLSNEQEETLIRENYDLDNEVHDGSKKA